MKKKHYSHITNLWQAFASRGLPAIAELLVIVVLVIINISY